MDPDRVRQLLGSLAEYRAELAELAALPAGEYAGRDAIAGRYYVQVAAQTCIDLANHVIASSRWRVPSDYADAFTVLAEHEALDGALAARMRDLARLRNLLVHAYGDVDDALIQRSLEPGIADLDQFGSALAALVADGT